MYSLKAVCICIEKAFNEVLLYTVELGYKYNVPGLVRINYLQISISMLCKLGILRTLG